MGNEQCSGCMPDIDCGGWFSEPQEELVYVAIIHSHGARGPLSKELQLLSKAKLKKEKENKGGLSNKAASSTSPSTFNSSSSDNISSNNRSRSGTVSSNDSNSTNGTLKNSISGMPLSKDNNSNTSKVDNKSEELYSDANEDLDDGDGDVDDIQSNQAMTAVPNIITQWEDSDQEIMTLVGQKQMKTLGHWFCQYYLRAEHPDFNLNIGGVSSGLPIKWVCGNSPRMYQSALDFAEGFQEALGYQIFPDGPRYDTLETIDLEMDYLLDEILKKISETDCSSFLEEEGKDQNSSKKTPLLEQEDNNKENANTGNNNNYYGDTNQYQATNVKGDESDDEAPPLGGLEYTMSKKSSWREQRVFTQSELFVQKANEYLDFLNKVYLKIESNRINFNRIRQRRMRNNEMDNSISSTSSLSNSTTSLGSSSQSTTSSSSTNVNTMLNSMMAGNGGKGFCALSSSDKLALIPLIQSLIESERFWPEASESPRCILMKLLKEKERETVKELSYWVWNYFYFYHDISSAILQQQQVRQQKEEEQTTETEEGQDGILIGDRKTEEKEKDQQEQRQRKELEEKTNPESNVEKQSAGGFGLVRNPKLTAATSQGCRLLDEIVTGILEQEYQHNVAVYSSHDGTILSLLACMGKFDKYPPPLMSYGAFLTIEVYRTNYNEELISVFLNPIPYKDHETGEALNEFQDARMLLLGDIPVTEFVEHLQSLKQLSDHHDKKLLNQDGEREEEGKGEGGGEGGSSFQKQSIVTEIKTSSSI